MAARRRRSICPSVSLSRASCAVLLTTCWFYGPVLLSVLSQRDPPPPLPTVRMSDFPIPQSGIGAFSVRRRNTNGDRRPAFFISGSNVRASDARHGFFNTPLSKTVTIDDLEAAIYSSIAPDRPAGFEAGIASPDVASTGLPSSCGRKTMPLRYHPFGTVGERGEQTHGLSQLLLELKHEILRKLAGEGVRVSLPIDVSHTTGVVVRSLHCEFYCNGKLDLSVDCEKAILCGSLAEAVLRGCVVIGTADGTTLVSNCVWWDLERNCFAVPGRYAFGCSGAIHRGRGLRCDHRLQVLGGCDPSGKEGAETWARRISR